MIIRWILWKAIPLWIELLFSALLEELRGKGLDAKSAVNGRLSKKGKDGLFFSKEGKFVVNYEAMKVESLFSLQIWATEKQRL